MPRMNLPELDARRVYRTSSGIRVPGVTDILKNIEDESWIPGYIQKYGRARWERKKQSAIALGNDIHTVAYNIAKNPEYVPPSAHLKPYASAIKDFHHAYIKRVIAVEFGLASDTERVGGTCDLYCELKDGSLCVVDYKSKGNNGSVTGRDRLQTAGYSLLVRGAGYTVNKRAVMLLRTDEGREGEWYVRFANDHEGDVAAFRAAVELYHWKPRAKYRYPKKVA